MRWSNTQPWQKHTVINNINQVERFIKVYDFLGFLLKSKVLFQHTCQWVLHCNKIQLLPYQIVKITSLKFQTNVPPCHSFPPVIAQPTYVKSLNSKSLPEENATKSKCVAWRRRCFIFYANFSQKVTKWRY